MKQYDIVIVGSGIIGATAALMLAKNSQLTIALLEANTLPSEWQADKHDHRVSAISLGSQKIFQALKLWDLMLKKRISPYFKMHVWESENPADIHFDCREANESALGFIIEDSVMRTTLLEKIKTLPNVDLISEEKVTALQEFETHLTLLTEKNHTYQTQLLIAADGANSAIRELAAIKMTSWDYHHTAIVATVETELSHHMTARQHFLPSGPLAFLPLQNTNQSSIVWSTSPEHAKTLLAQTERDFCETLSQAFANQLGAIKKTSARYHFPLRMRHAKNYVKNRLALIGDAAHTIHPLAGQGVNLGLLDAASLAEMITTALQKNRDFASLATLRKYERARKSDNLTMLAAVEGLKRLFATQHPMIEKLRSIGLKTVNRVSLLKSFFIKYALYTSKFSGPR